MGQKPTHKELSRTEMSLLEHLGGFDPSDLERERESEELTGTHYSDKQAHFERGQANKTKTIIEESLGIQ